MSYHRLYKEDRFLVHAIENTIKSKLGDGVSRDTEGAARALMRMFEIKLRAEPAKLRIECFDCEGRGKFVMPDEKPDGELLLYSVSERKCPTCNRKGYTEGDY